MSERTRYNRLAKVPQSPNYFNNYEEDLNERNSQARSRQRSRSPARGRSPGRPKPQPRPRNRSRTPSRSRRATTQPTLDVSPPASVSRNEGNVAPSGQYNSPSPAVPAANGAQKWKPNFDRFKPSIKLDKSAIYEKAGDILRVSFGVSFLAAVFAATTFSYLLCNKNRCKLPTKVPGASKLVNEISPINAYIYLGFFAIQFLFAYIPKHSGVISALVSLSSVGGLFYYKVYPLVSLLDHAVEFLALSVLTSSALATILFVKGYKRSRSSVSDKFLFGFLYGFRANNELFGKRLETIVHQIGTVQLAVINSIFLIAAYEAKFPFLFTAVLAINSVHNLDKIAFTGKKDYLPLDSGFLSAFLYLAQPYVSALSVFVAYKSAVKELPLKEWAFGAAALWLFGYYVYCKAKYNAPRRIAARSVKGIKSRLAYIWNIFVTSPWIGQAIIDLSIAGAVLPYSYVSLISALAFIVVTKVVPLLY